MVFISWAGRVPTCVAWPNRDRHTRQARKSSVTLWRAGDFQGRANTHTHTHVPLCSARDLHAYGLARGKLLATRAATRPRFHILVPDDSEFTSSVINFLQFAILGRDKETRLNEV